MPIKQIITDTKVPIKIWSDNIEDAALTQAINLANSLPIYSHLALMPDVHCGMGMPIGGVLPLINGICPNAVGSDIGCGMLACQLNLKEISLRDLKDIFSEIREQIPVGFNHRKERIKWYDYINIPDSPIIRQELQSSEHQCGTLGGGNHFLEFQSGSDGQLWFMIHSGSRNLGNKIATYYHKLALEHGEVPADNEILAYFDKTKQESLFNEYYDAMNFALEFAHMNRELMADVSCI